MNFNDIFDFLNSGGFIAAILVFAFVAKKFIDVAQVIADHTKTKKDNEVLDKIKAYAKTAVTFAQSLPAPGNDQMAAAKSLLVQWAKDANYDLSSDDAQKFAEEQYQLIYGKNKALTSSASTPLKTYTPSTQQAKAVAEVTKLAAQVDPTDYPIKLATGDLVEINGKAMKLNTDDSGKITLTPEGK